MERTRNPPDGPTPFLVGHIYGRRQISFKEPVVRQKKQNDDTEWGESTHDPAEGGEWGPAQGNDLPTAEREDDLSAVLAQEGPADYDGV